MTKRRERAKAQSQGGTPAPQISKQLDAAPLKPQREKDDNLIQLGKFFYSLAGLTYGGAVLGMALEFDIDKVPTFLLGMWAMISQAVLGYKFVKKGNK